MNHAQHSTCNKNSIPSHLKPPLFLMGRVVATPGALAVFQQHEDSSIHQCLENHGLGDWGELCSEDIQANDSALATGGRILSSYHVGENKIWIITEGDRSATTVLLPQEY